MAPEIRVLDDGDASALERFLSAQPSGITVRGNASAWGLTDGDGPTRGLYLGAVENGEVSGLVAHYDNGLHLVATRHLVPMLDLLSRRAKRPVGAIFGMTNVVAQARAWLDAADSRTVLDSRDELFTLRLSQLKAPKAIPGARCGLARPADAALLSRWRHDFMSENLGAPRGSELQQTSTQQISEELAASKLYALYVRDVPVATASFEPSLKDAVQVAYVYVPPEQRGRGYGTAITAGALQLAKDSGVSTAVLFTGLGNEPAQRAYRSIGFQPCGGYTMLVFHKPRLAAPGG